MAQTIKQTMDFVSKSNNLMSFDRSFAVLNGQPIDAESIFDSKTAAEAYATKATAYVGKIIVVVESEVVTAYVIDTDGSLKPIGDNIFTSTEKATQYAQKSIVPIGTILVVDEFVGKEPDKKEVVTAYVIDSDRSLKPIGDKTTMDKIAAAVAELQATMPTKASKAEAIGSISQVQNNKDRFSYASVDGTTIENTIIINNVAEALHATKATQDNNGNVIIDHYATKTDLSDKVSELEKLINPGMEFKGVLNITALTDLPTDGVKQGDTYKLGTAFSTYKVGDAIIAMKDVPAQKIDDNINWALLPAGDDIEDTWREIQLNGTSIGQNKLNIKGRDKVTVVSSIVGGVTTATINHNKVDAPTNKGTDNTRTYLTSVETDGYGHITGYKTNTEKVVDTNTWRNVNVNGKELKSTNINSGLINFKNGSNVTISSNSNDITINAADTHYEGKNVVGANETATTNGELKNPYLSFVENGTVRSRHQIKGAGATTVASDASGNITITSIDTDTKNTAGATDEKDTAAKLFLVGAKTQAESSQTYSQANAFIQAGAVYSENQKAATETWTETWTKNLIGYEKQAETDIPIFCNFSHVFFGDPTPAAGSYLEYDSSGGGTGEDVWYYARFNGRDYIKGEIAIVDDIPTKVTDLTDSGNYATKTWVESTATAHNASLLDGKNSAYYLNYNNLTNKPFIPSTPEDIGALGEIWLQEVGYNPFEAQTEDNHTETGFTFYAHSGNTNKGLIFVQNSAREGGLNGVYYTTATELPAEIETLSNYELIVKQDLNNVIFQNGTNLTTQGGIAICLNGGSASDWK